MINLQGIRTKGRFHIVNKSHFIKCGYGLGLSFREMKKRFSYSCFSLPQREFVFSLYTIRARDKERSILTISLIFSVRD